MFFKIVYSNNKAFFETGIKEMKIRTNSVVDVITQYLITFGPLFGDKKKR